VYGCLWLFQSLKQLFYSNKEDILGFTRLGYRKSNGCGDLGCFSNKNHFIIGKQLYVGEAAGLQDLLWRFDIRSSIISGFLAAKAIINNEDY
jgi:flavin-dependent dehydrogenase